MHRRVASQLYHGHVKVNFESTDLLGTLHSPPGAPLEVSAQTVIIFDGAFCKTW